MNFIGVLMSFIGVLMSFICVSTTFKAHTCTIYIFDTNCASAQYALASDKKPPGEKFMGGAMYEGGINF